MKSLNNRLRAFIALAACVLLTIVLAVRVVNCKDRAVHGADHITLVASDKIQIPDTRKTASRMKSFRSKDGPELSVPNSQIATEANDVNDSPDKESIETQRHNAVSTFADLRPPQPVIKLTIPSGNTIPLRTYETFGLFLFPNDQWVINNASSLAQLRNAFDVFGDAIGNRHLVVWLTKNNMGEEIDTARAKAYCIKFGCEHGTGPYLIVTRVNPDTWDQWRMDETLKLDFKGIRAERSTNVLKVLAEDLLKYRQGSRLPDRVLWAMVYEIMRNGIANKWRDLSVELYKPCPNLNVCS